MQSGRLVGKIVCFLTLVLGVYTAESTAVPELIDEKWTITASESDAVIVHFSSISSGTAVDSAV